jgi:hypothetical protein
VFVEIEADQRDGPFFMGEIPEMVEIHVELIPEDIRTIDK